MGQRAQMLEVSTSRSEWVVSTSSQTDSFAQPPSESSNQDISPSEPSPECSDQAASESCQKLSDKISELDLGLAEKNEQVSLCHMHQCTLVLRHLLPCMPACSSLVG